MHQLIKLALLKHPDFPGANSNTTAREKQNMTVTWLQNQITKKDRNQKYFTSEHQLSKDSNQKRDLINKQIDNKLLKSQWLFQWFKFTQKLLMQENLEVARVGLNLKFGSTLNQLQAIGTKGNYWGNAPQ